MQIPTWIIPPKRELIINPASYVKKVRKPVPVIGSDAMDAITVWIMDAISTVVALIPKKGSRFSLAFPFISSVSSKYFCIFKYKL